MLLLLEELMRFKFPSNPSTESISIDNITQGMTHVNKVPDAPSIAYGSCMAFPNSYYTPQIFVTWDSLVFIRGSINKDSKWVRVLTEDV